jgi:hypothetical protein
MRPVAQPWQASVFVLQGVAMHKPKDPALWAAALRGALVLTPEALEGRAGPGAAAIRYRGIRTATQLYVSPRFRSRHGNFWEVLQACLPSIPRLELLRRRADWRAAMGGRRRSLALVVSEEQAHEDGCAPFRCHLPQDCGACQSQSRVPRQAVGVPFESTAARGSLPIIAVPWCGSACRVVVAVTPHEALITGHCTDSQTRPRAGAARTSPAAGRLQGRNFGSC